MKRLYIFFASVAMLLAAVSAAQTTSEEFLRRYQLLSSKLGPAGLGIETLVQKWGESYPEDRDMLTARFLYYFNKAQSSEVKPLDRRKWLGEDPVITLKDSLGRDVRYFQVLDFDDALFSQAMEALDKAIRLNQAALDLRTTKVSALMAYEGESPDMAAQALLALVDYNAVSHPSWTYNGEAVDENGFCDLIQQYCYALYKTGSPSSMEAFRSVSGKMNGYYPRNTGFLNNLGSYYLVYKEDGKTALKYYGKVFKIDPKDYVAAKNCVLLSRRNKDVKMEKKYLPILIESSPDENEKTAARLRLDAINSSRK